MLALLWLPAAVLPVAQNLNAAPQGVLSIFGSSVAKGYGSSGEVLNQYVENSFSNGYAAHLTILMATNGWRVTNQSIPGNTTSNLIARFYTDEVPVHAGEVFIGLSLGNEGLPGAPDPWAIYNQFYRGITNLIAMSRSNNLIPLVGGQYPRNAYTTNEYVYLKSMDLLLNTLAVPVVNFLGATDDGQGHWGNLSAPDIWHPNDAGHYEMFLAIVPTVFDALRAGKPTPHLSSNQRYLRIFADPGQPAPLSFTPGFLIHSFSVSFRVRSSGTGTVASVTLPNSTVHPTVEITPTGLAYVASNGQVVNSGVSTTSWHDVVVAHQYNRAQTWFYLDGVLAGTASERLTPVGFVLGGPGSAASRPASPAQADYQNWFVHRSLLNAEEVQAQRQGALQQASLEIYAPLNDAAFIAGGTATNCAQSMSVVTINSSNVRSEPIGQVSYSAGGVTVSIPGDPNSPYELQRSDTPAFANYSVLLVTNAPADGWLSFTDTNPPPISAFYRTVRH